MHLNWFRFYRDCILNFLNLHIFFSKISLIFKFFSTHPGRPGPYAGPLPRVCLSCARTCHWGAPKRRPPLSCPPLSCPPSPHRAPTTCQTCVPNWEKIFLSNWENNFISKWENNLLLKWEKNLLSKWENNLPSKWENDLLSKWEKNFLKMREQFFPQNERTIFSQNKSKILSIYI